MNRTEVFHPMADRCAVDFGQCTGAQGSAQVDTRQDASDYGICTNPLTMKIVSDCGGYWLGIDGMLNDAIIDEFERLGLDELLD